MVIENESRAFTIGFVAVAALVTLFSMAFGCMTPDSWVYLDLAKSVQAGHGCTLDGAYVATEACGYPALIAGVHLLPITGDWIVSSKLLNFVLLLGSFALLVRPMKNMPLTALLLINPALFFSYSYTLSENLSLFASCGVWFCLDGLRISKRQIYYSTGLLIFLVLGCSARYFFAPFSFFFWLCYAVVYGKREAIRSLPAFAAASVCFVAYLYFNFTHTGYATGTDRLPAPESFGYLVIAFIMRVGAVVASMAITMSIFRLISIGNLRLAALRELPANWRSNDPEVAPYKFLLLTGLCYLALMFLIRSRISFDLFDYRIIGRGTACAVIGFIGLAGKPDHWSGGRWVPFGLLAAGIFSLAYSQSIENWKAAFAATYQTPQELTAAMRSTLHNKTIVTIFMPSPSNFIVGNHEYYDPASRIITLNKAPAFKPDTVKSLRAKISPYVNDDCVIDFTAFADRADFEAKTVDRTYPVSLDFSASRFKPGRIVQPLYLPEIRELMLKVFQPRSAVPCSAAMPG